MSENRETPAVGAPVEETEASPTEVMRAVERATGGPSDGAPIQNPTPQGSDAAEPGEVSAGEVPTHQVSADEASRREAASLVDTQMDLETPQQASSPPQTTSPRIAEPETMPSAAADPITPTAPRYEDTPERDGEIRISADHPMAALYTQTPAPPEIKGNRGAGALIAVLATVGFAIVYAGVIALLAAPVYPPSTFLDEGVLPQILSIGFAAAAGGFLLAMLLLVLIVGRAGWWAYVLGGFFVAVIVWLAAILGGAVHDRFVLGESVSWNFFDLIGTYGLTIPALAAAIVAREAAVWFGAWIGTRGRRVKQRNSQALAEYEQAVTEVQAKPR